MKLLKCAKGTNVYVTLAMDLKRAPRTPKNVYVTLTMDLKRTPRTPINARKRVGNIALHP